MLLLHPKMTFLQLTPRHHVSASPLAASDLLLPNGMRIHKATGLWKSKITVEMNQKYQDGSLRS